MDIFGLYQVSYLYIGLIGFCTTILVSLVTSFIIGELVPSFIVYDSEYMITVHTNCVRIMDTCYREIDKNILLFCRCEQAT